jgi:hypothetical protein
VKSEEQDSFSKSMFVGDKNKNPECYSQGGRSRRSGAKSKGLQTMTKIKIKVEKTETGFSAYADKYSAFTTGGSVEELSANMIESLNLLFEAEGKKRKVRGMDLTFEMELTSVFEVYSIINMKALSKRIGMNYTLLSQYAKGKKRPSPKQSEKIIESIHEIGRELAELNLVSH